MLQGVFHVRETCASIFEWVAEALRDAGEAALHVVGKV
jgi:hypothetical protein